MTTTPASGSDVDHRRLTELEASVLGVVASRGPLSAYAIRADFAASPTQRWSGSAGAIYPLTKRLRGRGLLAVEPRARGTKASTAVYSITAAGRDALVDWIVDDGSEAVAIPVDPVRTRVHFLEALEPSARVAWIARVERALDEQLAALQAEYEADAFPTARDRLIARGLLDLVEARRRWLVSVRRFFAAAC